MAVYKFVLESVAQNWKTVLSNFRGIVFEVSCETEPVVNLVTDYLISFTVRGVKKPIELDEMERVRTDRWLSWVAYPHNVLIPLHIVSHVLKRGCCIKTVQVIKILCGRFIPHHVSGCMSWWVTVPAPHVERGAVMSGCENSCKMMQQSSSVYCSFKDVNCFVVVQNAVILSLSYQCIRICAINKSMHIT